MKKLLLFVLSSTIFFMLCSCGDGDEKINTLDPIEISSNLNSIVFGENGDAEEIKFTANSSWQINLEETKVAPSWLTVKPMSGGVGAVTLSVDAKLNTTFIDRKAIIEIVAGGKKYPISVKQDALKRTITIDKVNESVGVNKGSFVVNVTSNDEWNTSGVPDWVTLTPNKGQGNKAVEVSYTENDTFVERNAEIKFSVHGIDRTLIIIQSERHRTLDIDKIDESVDASKGSFVVNVTSNDDWSTSDVPDWITLTPDKATGNQAVEVSYTENDTKATREAIITFSVEGVDKTLKITQSFVTPIMTIDKSNENIPNSQGELIVNVDSNVKWQVSGVPWWITLSHASGMGSSSITVYYKKNDMLVSRNANIKFKIDGIEKVLNIIQAAGIEEVVIKDVIDEYVYNKDAGTRSLEILSNTSWHVENMPDWITITPSSGTGNQTVIVENTKNETISTKIVSIKFVVNGNVALLNIAQQPGDKSMTISEDVVTVSDNSKSFTVTINSNIDWDATMPLGVNLSHTQGVAGVTQVTIGYGINTTSSKRVIEVEFKGKYPNSSIKQKISITQLVKNQTVDEGLNDDYNQGGQGW